MIYNSRGNRVASIVYCTANRPAHFSRFTMYVGKSSISNKLLSSKRQIRSKLCEMCSSLAHTLQKKRKKCKLFHVIWFSAPLSYLGFSPPHTDFAPLFSNIFVVSSSFSCFSSGFFLFFTETFIILFSKQKMMCVCFLV